MVNIELAISLIIGLEVFNLGIGYLNTRKLSKADRAYRKAKSAHTRINKHHNE